MHDEARTGFAQVLADSELDPAEHWRVLDIGGQDVNGTVHDLLPNARFTVLDLLPLPGSIVDVVADARTWVPDRLFDVVISTELLEHVPGWQAIIGTAAAALDPDGPQIFLMTCASTGRDPHGMHGDPIAPGEHYGNVGPGELADALADHFEDGAITFNLQACDVYAWAQKAVPAVASGVTR